MLLLALAPLVLCAPADDPDRDGDGLSDFHEVHKHLTDPRDADSDGDGVPDGDWLERREYQYTVRSVVQVMKPVTPEHLTDDYQDARVLDETDTYVELEVIHYPFNTVASAIEGDRSWRRSSARSGMSEWLEPGPTSDWTPELRKRILADLEADGIDVSKLDDREAVERVSRWLVQRARMHDGFTAFVVAFDRDGRPYVPDELRGARSVEDVERQLEREVSAAGMYEQRTRGSCSSSAIYLSGCLRAAGIPTRTVLCIPVVDAGDEREMEMVERNVRHAGVRQQILGALRGLADSWSSHTFNEVWVGGRWRRLDYDVLGRGIYAPDRFGLLTHVATFRDWADARMPETIGQRQKGSRTADVFGGNNPYSTISLRDEIGPHCTLEWPPEDVRQMDVERLYWSDSDELPDFVLEAMAPRGRFGLVAHLPRPGDHETLLAFLADADAHVTLEAPDHELFAAFDPNCVWTRPDGTAWVYVALRSPREELRSGVRYRAVPRNERDAYAWAVPQEPLPERD